MKKKIKVGTRGQLEERLPHFPFILSWRLLLTPLQMVSVSHPVGAFLIHAVQAHTSKTGDGTVAMIAMITGGLQKACLPLPPTHSHQIHTRNPCTSTLKTKSEVRNGHRRDAARALTRANTHTRARAGGGTLRRQLRRRDGGGAIRRAARQARGGARLPQPRRTTVHGVPGTRRGACFGAGADTSAAA